jgi:hypothetical protein
MKVGLTPMNYNPSVADKQAGEAMIRKSAAAFWRTFVEQKNNTQTQTQRISDPRRLFGLNTQSRMCLNKLIDTWTGS